MRKYGKMNNLFRNRSKPQMSHQNRPLINVEFSMTSDSADLEEITRVLELTPSRTRKKKDWPKASIDAGVACDLWEIESQQITSRLVDAECKKIISLLKGKEELMQALCNKYGMELHFEVVVHMNSFETPAIFLEKETVSFLAKINADIGFDIYTYA